MRAFQLSVKGGLLFAFSPPDSRFPVLPISLEFQNPANWSENLSWLVTAGGGAAFPPGKEEPVFFLDTGLRYNFQPLTFSLGLGAYITPSLLKELEPSCFDCYLPLLKTEISIGWETTNGAHIMGTVGAYYAIFPFAGISVSIPLKL